MGNRKPLRVVVLTGGTSAEREVCLMSGRKVLGALDRERYEAVSVDLADITASGDVAPLLLAFGPGGRPDVVFVALHGGAGENGTVQGMLELLGVPYTGSGVLASALALNKVVAKKLFAREGIPTPRWLPVREAERAGAAERIVSTLGLPCVVKPGQEGSSIGVTIVKQQGALEEALDLAFRYGPEALVEEYIAGTEITGPVLGNDAPKVLPLIEIVPKNEFYDYEAKYTPGATDEIIPARITEAQAERARELTLATHRLVGCRGMSRVDMIVAPDEVYVLELQTIPGLTDTSLVPRAAEAAGISFPQLVDRLIELALEERGGGASGRES
jgi:D-alanine-D-alanine ligase